MRYLISMTHLNVQLVWQFLILLINTKSITLAHANLTLIGIPLLKHAIVITLKAMQKFNKDAFVARLFLHLFFDINVLKDLYDQIFILGLSVFMILNFYCL